MSAARLRVSRHSGPRPESRGTAGRQPQLRWARVAGSGLIGECPKPLDARFRGQDGGLCLPAPLRVSPNPPMDTDGRREDTGRGVRKLQKRWSGLEFG